MWEDGESTQMVELLSSASYQICDLQLQKREWKQSENNKGTWREREEKQYYYIHMAFFQGSVHLLGGAAL